MIGERRIDGIPALTLATDDGDGLAERCVSALGSDGNSDTTPSTTEGIDFPIHALALNAMGVHLLDYLQFEDLAAACERERRWEFLFASAPLRVVGETGSPLNPIAIL